MKALLTVLLISNLALADDVKVVKKGETVPFDGVLFTKELEKQIRSDTQILEKKVDTLTRINSINEQEITILNQRVSLYQEKAKEMADREVKQESSSFWKNAAYFISGAVLTGVIGYGVIKAYR